MTPDEIMKLEAGRELDALVAEHVMGWVKRGWDWQFTLPSYSTDIAAAWQVVEKDIAQMTLWRSRFKPCLVSVDLCIGDDHYKLSAPTAPLAICRAALLAVMDNRP